MTGVKHRAVGLAIAVAVCVIWTPWLRAYVLKDGRWPDGAITMHLQLGESGPLIDGSANWGASVEGAMATWNQHFSRVRFTVVRNSTSAIARGNSVNNVFFSDTLFGQSFGEAVAIAQSWTLGTTRVEADVVFNNAKSWNAYRGAVRSGPLDIRRVALHELGHVLGLDHPDEASQFVQAVMNSRVSDTDALTSDDIAGGQALYLSGFVPPPPPPTPTPTPPPPPPPVSSTYPASAHPYADNVDTSWAYTLPGNPSAINVTFDARTKLEEGFDFVHVMDGNGNRIAGSPFTGIALAGQTVRVVGATVRIRLTTDSSLVDWGFAVTNVVATVAPPPSPFPSSAHPYTNSHDFTWSYTLAGNPAAINVTFDQLTQVEDRYDYIYVSDGTGAAVSGSPFTGTSLAGQTIRVNGNTVRVRLTSDSSITGWGFAIATVTAAAAPPSGSGFPASPHPYSNSVDQSWSYRLPGNPQAISVTFDPQTEVEQGYDYIHVMDANGADATGSPFTGRSLAGRAIVVRGDTVRIRLTTDPSVTGWGFAVTAVTASSAVPPPVTSSPYPQSTHPYTDNLNQSFSYTQPGNPAAINVTFDPRTEVETGYDFIYVMDGNGNNIAGSPFTGTSLAGTTKRVTGATVRIRLTTDFSLTGWGFAVTNVTASLSSVLSTSTKLRSVDVSQQRAAKAPPKPASSPVKKTPVATDRGAATGVIAIAGPPALASPARVYPSQGELRDFQERLERKFSASARASTTFVDPGDGARWIAEYVAYRLSRCTHASAEQRVMARIEGLGVQPLCSLETASEYPRVSDVMGFRQALEAKYRDGLRRRGQPSSVDEQTEASSVLQYLRWRSAACSHDSASVRVLNEGERQAPASACR